MIFGQTFKISGGDYAPTLDIGVIEVDTSVAPSTIYLPNIFASTAVANSYKLIVVDISNNASSNPITIACSNGQKVNGSTSILLNNNGVTAGFIPFGVQYWIGSYDSGNSGSIGQLSVNYSLTERVIGTIETSLGVFETLYQQSIILPQPITDSTDSYDTAIQVSRVISVEAFTVLGVWAFGSSVLETIGSCSEASSFQAEASSGNIIVNWEKAPNVGGDMYITFKYTK